MGRTDPEFSTDRSRASLIDVCEVVAPSTIADQLRNDGWLRPNMPTAPDGTQVHPPARYPLPGNAGFDNDNDADDYNQAAKGGPASNASSSSGPP
jgi:hypothetical protein